MAEVARRVVRLLERAQHQRRERRAAVPAAAHLLVDEVRGLRDQLARLLRASGAPAPAASGRRATPAARAAARTRGGSGGSWTRNSAGSLRASSSPATASLAAIIRNSISRCDSVCSDGSSALDVAVAREAELGLAGLHGQRAARLARVRERRSHLARRRQRRRPRLLGPLGAREDPVHARVVEPLVGADDRAVEGRAADLRALELELDGHRQPVLARAPASTPGSTAPRAASARPGRARRPSSRAGTPRGRARSRAARRPRRRRCAPTRGSRRRRSSSAEIASSKSRAVGGSIVKVVSARKSRPAAARRARRCAPRARPAGRSAAAARAGPSAPRARRARRPGARSAARSARGRPAGHDDHEVADALAALAACRR